MWDKTYNISIFSSNYEEHESTLTRPKSKRISTVNFEISATETRTHDLPSKGGHYMPIEHKIPRWCARLFNQCQSWLRIQPFGKEEIRGLVSKIYDFFLLEHSLVVGVSCLMLRKSPTNNLALVVKLNELSCESCVVFVLLRRVGMDFEEFLQSCQKGVKQLVSAVNYLCVFNNSVGGLSVQTLLKHKAAMEGCNGVGVWRIVRVDKERLYENAAMNGVIPKYLTHRLFPNAKYSIWADAKMRLVVDPLLLVHSLVVKEGMDMAISKHPLYLHTMEEAMATARWKKWGDVEALRVQMETYCENGMQPWTSKKPYPSDVPDSAVIIRKHSKATNLFSCLLFNELEAFNPRDQLPFAYVRDSMNPKLSLNMFEVEVFEHVAVEYRHNLKHGGASGTQVGPRANMASSADGLSNIGSKCDGYLLQMWGKSK
nr:uncharacterized protein LOC109191984 [Ipomoea batatas]